MKEKFKLSNEDIELLRRTMCKDLSNDDFIRFVRQCERTGLDPFSRQIYFIQRWDAQEKQNTININITIDGYRLLAERTGLYAGQTPPEWCGKDGVWRDVWLDKDHPPYAARVGIYRKDFAAPVYAVARYDSYVQYNRDGKPNATWQKMPDLQLAKCAEALALRKAFPAEMSGLYTPEEMGSTIDDLINNEQQSAQPTKAVEEQPKKSPNSRPYPPEIFKARFIRNLLPKCVGQQVTEFEIGMARAGLLFGLDYFNTMDEALAAAKGFIKWLFDGKDPLDPHDYLAIYKWLNPKDDEGVVISISNDSYLELKQAIEFLNFKKTVEQEAENGTDNQSE